MFAFVQFRYAVVLIVIVILASYRIHCLNAESTARRGGVDVFNLLLGLYQLNPLKASKVYSKFAKDVLTQGDIMSILDSNEQTKKRNNFQELKRMENIIHPLIKIQKHSVEKPKYDIENFRPENFNVNLMLRHNFETEFSPNDEFENINILKADSTIKNYENVMAENATSTKLLPVTQLLLPHSNKLGPKLTNKLDAVFGVDANESQNKQITPESQEPFIISDNELTAGVVVL